MIQRLKTKFICLAMGALLVLLVVIVAAMNIVNYSTIVSEADRTLIFLSQNRGTFPNFDQLGKKLPAFMTAETPYETRYFSVLLSDTGTILHTDTNKIKAVDHNTAAQYAGTILRSGKNSGFYGNFRFIHYPEEPSSRIIFLDCSNRINSCKTFLYSSIAMAVTGYLAFFAVILFFSGRFVKPVAESYEKQKRFITDAGHEIKTPLAIMKADADVLEMEWGESEWLEDIQAQIDRLTALTADLVYLARMEESESSLPMLPFPLSDVVKETAQSFQALAQTHNKVFTLTVPELITLKGNEKAIRQLVSILMDNAIKYSPDEGTIALTLRKTARHVFLTVSNTTRETLTEETIAHLFDRFYRADPSRSSATGGYGIGLSVAKAICAAHNAKISAVTREDRILEITVQFPL